MTTAKSPLGGKLILLIMLVLVFAFGYAMSLTSEKLADTFLIMKVIGFSFFWGLMELTIVKHYLENTKVQDASIFTPLYILLTAPLFILVSHPVPELAFLMYVVSDIFYYLFKPKYFGVILEKPFTRALRYIPIGRVKIPVIYLLCLGLVLLIVYLPKIGF